MPNSHRCRHSLVVDDDEDAAAKRTQEGREMTKLELSGFLPSWVEKEVSCICTSVWMLDIQRGRGVAAR